MPNIATSQAQFDPAFRAAQPKDVQALMEMPTGERAAQAAKLASEGFVIDVPIMVWGWSAWITTQNRMALGYKWVPSALQPPVTMIPGIQQAGIQPYEPNIIPAGAIVVTLDLDALAAVYAPVPGSAAAQLVAEGK